MIEKMMDLINKFNGIEAEELGSLCHGQRHIKQR
jgi:hypothetical protein